MDCRFPALLAIVLLASPLAKAGEHPACIDLGYDYRAHDSTELRSIAASCTLEQRAILHYNRAYHADLVTRAQSLSVLIPFSGRERQRHYALTSYRYYIALVEAIAPSWYPEPDQRVAFLNAQYDRHGEIAELRLKGNDLRANYLERKAVAQ